MKLPIKEGIMNDSVKEKWVAALRSGSYMQGKNHLMQVHANGQQEYCCLGVLCDIAEKEGIVTKMMPPSTAPFPHHALYTATNDNYDRNTFTLPLAVRAWAGLRDNNPEVRASEDTEIGMISGFVSLAQLNDEGGASFSKIADLIEEQL